MHLSIHLSIYPPTWHLLLVMLSLIYYKFTFLHAEHPFDLHLSCMIHSTRGIMLSTFLTQARSLSCSALVSFSVR